MGQETEIKVTFDVPAHVIYKVFTDQMMLCQMTQGPAVCQPQPGGKFELFDGNIMGEFVSLEENALITMKWKFKDWDAFSDMQMTFTPGGNDSVNIAVSFKEVPDYTKH